VKRCILRGDLEVVVIPSWGGKTVSIKHRASGRELLFQRPGASPHKPRMEFGEWAFGWDDCWPSVEAAGPDYPDHGALWSLPGRAKASPGGLTVEIEPPGGRWHYTKTWQLDASSLKVRVQIANLGSEPLPAFWTLHALVRAEDDMRLVFPGADTRKTVHGEDFSPQALPRIGGTGKFWLPRAVEKGFCGIDYPSLGMAYRLNWDPEDLPYLGYWVTNGGFRGERNAAWEPSDGFYDSLVTAEANRALPVLAPGNRKSFSFTLTWSPLP
jgi:galactose mutarotase-like enzyme